MDGRQSFHYIVLGLGGVGSGTLYWLSKAVGADVFGIEQFKLAHDNGGSQDHSRIIRKGYHDDRYSKLVSDMYKSWAEVEKDSGIQLVWNTGQIKVAKVNSSAMEAFEKYATSMSALQIPYERLSGEEISQRFPQFSPGKDYVGLYQKDGGVVDAALANGVHIQLAQAHGATVIDQCPVVRIQATSDGGAQVHTAKGTFSCRRLIVTAGAWINEVLSGVGVHVPVAVTQEQVTYYGTPNLKDFTKDRCPIYSHMPDDKVIYYFMPIHGNSGVKIGLDAAGPVVGPNTRNFIPDSKREQACTELLQKHIPKALGPILYTKTCLYTMTYDRDFVVDSLAAYDMPQIIVCCGAGHAFKFASLLGKILSELACNGTSQYDIKGFSLDRPAIKDPNFQPVIPMNYSLVNYQSKL